MASGWWDDSGAISGCVAAHAPIGSASLAASYVNLQNPATNDAAPVGGSAPSFAALTGWGYNGTSQYLEYAGAYLLSGSTEQTVIMRVNITAGAKRGLFSEGTSGASELIFVESDREFKRRGTTTSITRTLPTNADSVVAIVCAAGAMTVYENGSAVATGAGHSGAFSPSGNGTRIGGVFAGSGGGTFYMAGSMAAIALYRAALTGPQIATLTTLMNALPVSSAKGLPIIQHYHRQVWG